MRIALLLLALLSCAVAAAADVPVVDNPRQAPRQTTVRYEEVWRAGADETADYIFGVIGGAVADADGNVYLLDIQQQQVFKFSPNGDYLGLVSRKGEGPGEIDRCYVMRTWADEGLGLLTSFPARITRVDFTGQSQGVITLGKVTGEDQSFLSGSDFAVRDGHLLASGRIMTYAEDGRTDTYFLSSFGPDGAELHSFGTKIRTAYDFSKTIVVDEVADFVGLQRWALGRDGEVYIAPERDAYLIEVRDAAGELVRTIRRDFPPHRRTAEEKEKAKENYSFSANMELPEIRYDIDDVSPPISDLACVGDELLVASSDDTRDALPDGVARSHDVFDLEGHLLEHRSHVLPLDPEEDTLTILPDGRAVRVANRQSAYAASVADLNIQVGDEKLAGSDNDAMLEVIVYAPVAD